MLTVPQHTTRNYTVDHLRGIGILLVLFLHVLALYFSRAYVFPIWNYAHFAVPIFVFCATYVFFAKSLNHDNFHYPSYVLKRTIRLLKPYYVFLLIHFILMAIFQPQKLQFPYLISSIFLYGGIDVNWLVLLFVEFIILLPLLRYLILYQKKLFYVYSFLAFASGFILLFYKPAVPYKFYFWLPWSIVSIMTYYFYTYHEKRYFHIIIAVFSMAVYLISQLVLVNYNQSLDFHANKYPPDTYYLFYGIFLLNILYFLSKKGLFSHTNIHSSLSYLSAKSFELYFIHSLILYIFIIHSWHTHFPWPVFFVFIVVSSIAIERLMNAGISKLIPQK